MIGHYLCRVGLHKWSEPRGGIKICRRDGCRASTTYGLQGTMRWLQWRDELYTQYKQFEGEKETDDD